MAWADIDQRTFAEEVSGAQPIHLARAALLFARGIAYPDLRPSVYLERLERWAETARARSAADVSALARAMTLTRFLFDELGLLGNQEDYYDPRNSFLNDVIDRRRGLPISLSVIFLDLAQRIGLIAEGIGLPGHFVVAVRTPEARIFLDPFHGGMMLTMEDMVHLVGRATGYDGPLRPEWLISMEPDAILARMLLNLLGLYLHQEQWSLALATVEHLHTLHPDTPDYLRDLGLLYARTRALRRAVECLEEYLQRFPTAADADVIRQTVAVLVEQMARWN